MQRTLLSQTTLLRWLNFLIVSQTVILSVLLFWIYLFLLMLLFVLQWLSLRLEIQIMLFSQFPLTFHQSRYIMPHFITQADCDGLHDHLRDIPQEDIFKLSASAAASEFCEWLQVGIDVYIPHRKYQAKPHSSPWHLAACAAATAHINIFFSFVPTE